MANGDLSKKITVDVRGEILAQSYEHDGRAASFPFASEVTRVAREVGTDGRLGGQAVVPGVAGTWKDLTDSVNAMATNLWPKCVTGTAMTTAVATFNRSQST